MSTRCDRLHQSDMRPWRANYYRTLISPLSSNTTAADKGWLGSYMLVDELNRKWYEPQTAFWQDHCKRFHATRWQCTASSQAPSVLYGLQYRHAWGDSDDDDANGDPITDYLTVQTEGEYLAEECGWLKQTARAKAPLGLKRVIDAGADWTRFDDYDRLESASRAGGVEDEDEDSN